MKTYGESHFPAPLSSKALTSSLDSDLQKGKKDRKPNRRKVRNPGFSGTGIRLKRDGAPSGKRSGPATPLLRWKFDDGDFSVDGNKAPECGRKIRRKVKKGGEVSVSVRKLAAGLWYLQLPEVSGAEGRGMLKRNNDRLGLEPVVGHVGVPYLCNPNGNDNVSVKDHLPSRISLPHPKNGTLYKLEPSVQFPNSAMERATKWDPGCSQTTDSAFKFYGHLKLLEDQQITTVSLVSALQAELEQAQTRIHELESERQSSKKKLEHFLKKLAEEKATWRTREHEKVRAIIGDVKDDLNRERKNRQRLEIVNSKLVNELAEAKLSAKRLLQEYEKERKGRELMEEVCDELAKEIGEDKAEVEALKRESMKIREEVEEERKMLQMAEVWREERVQMKLIEAKVTLEEKYSQMSKLIADLKAFLSSRTVTDAAETREAQMLKDAASSIKVQDIKEFSYQPPTSEDIFSVFEELHSGEANEREIGPCYGYSPVSRASKVHTVSPEINGLDGNPMQRYSDGRMDRSGELDEDGSGWETVSHVEEQGSSNSPDGSDPSVNGFHEESNFSESGTEWEENADNDTINTEITEIYPASVKQSRKKVSSITRLWRSVPTNGDNCKTIPVEVTNGRLSNGRMPNGVVSPDRVSGEGGLTPPSVGQWSSPDSGNPHITRAMKGCIEWPRGPQKNSLKAKLLEARMESQKVQLRQVLKQKI